MMGIQPAHDALSKRHKTIHKKMLLSIYHQILESQLCVPHTQFREHVGPTSMPQIAGTPEVKNKRLLTFNNVPLSDGVLTIKQGCVVLTGVRWSGVYRSINIYCLNFNLLYPLPLRGNFGFKFRAPSIRENESNIVWIHDSNEVFERFTLIHNGHCRWNYIDGLIVRYNIASIFSKNHL